MDEKESPVIDQTNDEDNQKVDPDLEDLIHGIPEIFKRDI